ncbi:hypothetical protein [Paraburkholderia sp. BR14320]|uniref:hypothetical protein n=1 Tax=unclassified Paraburkholderia TaxID=2615204 RepID=UPI0034CE5ABB
MERMVCDRLRQQESGCYVLSPLLFPTRLLWLDFPDDGHVRLHRANLKPGARNRHSLVDIVQQNDEEIPDNGGA